MVFVRREGDVLRSKIKRELVSNTEAVRQRIVLVDDDPSYLDAIRSSSQKHRKQLEVVLHASAEPAIAYIAFHTVDLIVLDAQMPGTGGVEACRILRERGVEIPLALMSGHMSCELEHDAYDVGATYAISKPVDLLALLRRAAGNDPIEIQERQKLIEAHLDVARNIARRLSRQYAPMLDREDIDGPAMLGLCEAAARYDRARPEPFIAFAERRIRGAIIDEVRRLGTEGRITYKRQRKISGARRAIIHEGHEPTDDRVAEHLGICTSTIQKTAKRLLRVLDDVSTIPSTTDSPEVQVQEAEVLAKVSLARLVLSEDEATIIRLRYDLGLSLAKIAGTLNLTSARVAQLHRIGVARLRDAIDG